MTPLWFWIEPDYWPRNPVDFTCYYWQAVSACYVPS